jgi:hypothetical protein
MRILEYSDLDLGAVSKDYKQVKKLLEDNQFKACDFKKLKGFPFYRVKLNYADRLLLMIVQFNGSKILVSLEIIVNHAYEKSRFLRGASIQESEILWDDIPKEDIIDLMYLSEKRTNIHYLKKFISFDDLQEKIYSMQAPLIISGPAGSGKTLVLLEKMKLLRGLGLYVTHSRYLVDHARQLYFSNGYRNENQEIDFLGLKQLIEKVDIPSGMEMDVNHFKKFTANHLGSSLLAKISRDPQKLYEEFCGVLTGGNLKAPFLSRTDYLQLGVKQTIFLEQDRSLVYTYFEKYLTFLKLENFFDLNIATWSSLTKVKSDYDFVVVDEIQDLTPVQIHFILKFLKKPDQFIFCGDGHQIVHPNFFSWAKLKTYLYELQEEKKINFKSHQLLQVITNNFRNAKKITELSNKILLIKNLRFGAIDRESHYLLKAEGASEGSIQFFQNNPKLCIDLNQKTKKSTKWAIIVLNDEQKNEVKNTFQTPLVFTIHEAKGLEYEHVILYNFISPFSLEFKLISEGLDVSLVTEHLESSLDLEYSRQKDKEDKSLEALKFFINSTYVAVTRAIESVIWIEEQRKHPFFDLIQAESRASDNVESLKEEQSSLEDWQREASKLAAQGKLEQAQSIRDEFLEIVPVPWKTMTLKDLRDLRLSAIDEKNYNKKDKQKLYDFSHLYWLPTVFDDLVKSKFTRAKEPLKDVRYVHNQYDAKYSLSNMRDLKRDVQKHGPSFLDEMSRPVVMAAVQAINPHGLQYLIEAGANLEQTDLFGVNALQRFLSLHQVFATANLFREADATILYELLAQKPLNFRYKNRLIVIMPHKAEYFLMNYLIGVFAGMYLDNISYVSSSFLEHHIQNFPDSILPSWRKTRTYWNGILAKNHCLKENSIGNLYLLLRVKTGIYILNPELEVEQSDGQWVKIYAYFKISFLNLLTEKVNFLERFLGSKNVETSKD